jgi:integrase
MEADHAVRWCGDTSCLEASVDTVGEQAQPAANEYGYHKQTQVIDQVQPQQLADHARTVGHQHVATLLLTHCVVTAAARSRAMREFSHGASVRVPDAEFNEIFARLPSHRDRALVAFYVSTGARAAELLSVTQGGVDPGRQLITVVRKGSGAAQQLPASSDAFVWLRLYQLELEGRIPTGRRQPLWWTLRRPARPLTYHAAHWMFARVNARAGTSATLHSLRHTAAYRMAEDPALPLTDVQLVLGHAQLSTTQIYLTPRKEDVIRRLLAHHAEQTKRAAERVVPTPAPGYRPETLQALFGVRG